MVQINFAQKTVNAKIVYYGPGMSGKTTNLEVVHQRAPEQNRGDLTSISTDGDRTLFFDFMPLDLGTVAGMRTAFQIYTVPGQVYYNSTRKLVLQGVDGVVFVADSAPSMIEENLESLRNLEENLNEYGKSLQSLPLIIQYNKRDLPDALSVDELNARMNPYGAPTFEAVANTGQGVFPTLKALAATVLENIHKTSGGSSPAPAPAPAPQPMAPAPQPAPMAAPQPQPMAPQPAPVPQQQYAAAPAPGAPVMGQTGFQPQPHLQQQQQQQPAYAQPQASAPMAPPAPPVHHQPPPQQPHQPQQPQQPHQPQQHGGMGLQPPAPPAPPAAAPPGGLRMADGPPAMPAGPAPAPAPVASKPPMPSPAQRKKLEQTRFRPRSARPEPRATPVAKSTGSKVYTWVFVALALAVGAVLTKVIISFL